MWNLILPALGLVVLRLAGFPTADVLVLAGLCLLAAPCWRLVAARLDGMDPAPVAPETAPETPTGD